jgi:hypothetical protein
MAEPISNNRARLADWLNVSPTGGNVPDMGLDLLNRANRFLEGKRRWDMLRKTLLMTLDSNRSFALPSNCEVIEEVFVDNVIVGKPQIYFYEDCSDVAFRYTKEYTFDQATGNSFYTITFPTVSPLLSAPKVRYKISLPDFTGEGDEFAIWPPNLLLRAAQKIHAEEKGVTGDNVQFIFTSFQEMFRDFEMKAQYNNQMADLTPHNKFGMPIHISGMTMSGGTQQGGTHSPYTPAQQAGFHGY